LVAPEKKLPTLLNQKASPPIELELKPNDQIFAKCPFSGSPLAFASNGNGYVIMNLSGNPYVLQIGSNHYNNIIREQALKAGKRLA
jgi:hypothetical protein